MDYGFHVHFGQAALAAPPLVRRKWALFTLRPLRNFAMRKLYLTVAMVAAMTAGAMSQATAPYARPQPRHIVDPGMVVFDRVCALLRSRAAFSLATSAAFSNCATAPSTCLIRTAVGVVSISTTRQTRPCAGF